MKSEVIDHQQEDRPRIMYIAGKKYCQLRDSSVEGFRVLGN